MYQVMYRCFIVLMILFILLITWICPWCLCREQESASERLFILLQVLSAYLNFFPRPCNFFFGFYLFHLFNLTYIHIRFTTAVCASFWYEDELLVLVDVTSPWLGLPIAFILPQYHICGQWWFLSVDGLLGKPVQLLVSADMLLLNWHIYFGEVYRFMSSFIYTFS